MTQSFWINNYLVDLSRNQLKFKGDEIQLPKKELAVLTLLAKNAGEVVSHDQLMEHIWGDSVVSPNTLQRYIAQLRKAFGDNSKKQSIIKTHPKQGYSLEATVRWEKKSNSGTHTSSYRIGPYLFSLILLIFIVGIYLGFDKTEKPVILLNSLSPITATDADEDNPRYSPDGKYLVYRRYSKSHGVHIWAKNLSTNVEVQLTAESAKYGSFNWSYDSSHLAFSVLLLEPGRQKPCWQIQTIDFTKALKTPQKTDKRSACQPNRMAVSRWLTNGDIAVLVRENDKNHSLQSYNLITDQLTEIYSPDNQDVYSYDFSNQSNVFAVVSRNDKNQHVVEKVDLNGKVLSTAFITLEQEHSAHEYYNVYFDPNGNYLLTSSALGLFQLSFNGKMQKINTFGYRNLSQPLLHPEENKLVAVQESIDQDIAIIDINNATELNGQYNNQAISIARSNQLDAAGAFQPNGELIAFVSNRTGKNQIWLFDGEVSRQLTHFKTGLQTSDFAWSPTGNEIATVSNDTLMILSLDGKSQAYSNSLLISKVMQWTANNKIIIIANQANENTAFSLALDRKKLNIEKLNKLQVSKVEWLKFIDIETFVYLDSDRKTWLHSSTAQTPVHIELLMGKIGRKRLTLDKKILYGINHKKQLWRYDLQLNTLTTIKQLPSTSLYISDYRKDKAIVTHSLSHNKEIVELSK